MLTHDEQVAKIKAQIFNLNQDANHWDSKMQDCWDHENDRGAQKFWNKVVKINKQIESLKDKLKFLEK